MKRRGGVKRWSNIPGWCDLKIMKNDLAWVVKKKFADIFFATCASELDIVRIHVRYISSGMDDPGVTSAPADYCREPWREEERRIVAVSIEDEEINEEDHEFADVADSLQPMVDRAIGHLDPD